MNVGEVFTKLALDQKQYEKGFDRAEAYTRQKALTLGSLFKGAFSFALGIGLVQGFRSLGGAITDFVNTAARTEVLDIAMQSVARSSGYAIAALNAQRMSVMDLGIAEQEATQILTRFMQAQLNTADAAKLARVAQDAAVIAGYNSSQAAEQMTEAIAKQRPELLSAFGMTRNMLEIYKDYAATVGKTTAQLSEAEKKQAMLNYILAEGKKIAGTYEASMGVVGKQIRSLPRYWDTLKNAIAMPLTLPALSVIVGGITNSLKNAINWAEANTVTLQRWGQTAVNVANAAIRGFQYVTRAVVENWALIKIAGAALLTYAVGVRAVAGATAVFSAVSLALKGQLVTTVPILGLVSEAVWIYRRHLFLATVQKVAMAGAAAKLKLALWSLWTALGPVGWAIIALSAIVGAGMALWNRYTKSLQQPVKTALGMGDLKKVEESIKGAASGAEDQADALKEAGKAAGNNLQSFDEIHSLQEEMAAGDMPGLDTPETNIPDYANIVDEMLAGMGEGLETELPPLGERIKGFFAWIWDGIKSGATTAWNGITGVVKKAWDSLVNLAKPIWEPVAKFLSSLWEGIVNIAKIIWDPLAAFFTNLWGNVKSVFETVWNAIVFTLSFIWFSIVELAKATWSVLGPFFTALWDGIRAVVLSVWNTLQAFFATVWGAIIATAKAVWGVLGPFFSGLWNGIKVTVETVWNAVSSFLAGLWNFIKSTALTVWDSIRQAVENPVEAARETVQAISEKLRDVLISTWEWISGKALSIWGFVKTHMVDPMREAWTKVTEYVRLLKDGITQAWDGILKKVTDLKGTLYKRIMEPWESAKEKILDIIKDAYGWGKNFIDNIVDGIKSAINKVQEAGGAVAGALMKFIGFSSPTKEGPGRDADKWAPNLMKMYSEGISGGASSVRSAVSEVAGQLTGLTAQPSIQPVVASLPAASESDFMSDGIAQAVYKAVLDAFRITQASQSGSSDNREIVLKINNTVLAREQLPAIIKEGQRQGLNFVVRPQGG